MESIIYLWGLNHEHTKKKNKFIFHLDVKSTFKNIKKVENAHSIVAIEIKRVIKYKYNYSLNKLIDY